MSCTRVRFHHLPGSNVVMLITICLISSPASTCPACGFDFIIFLDLMFISICLISSQASMVSCWSFLSCNPHQPILHQGLFAVKYAKKLRKKIIANK
ncbi:hypothetical protein HanHA300_Chr03g0089611 [Helianthus annuus]|nr:hypothetical protein HanHA300_Chr03g0089611 [Helianthus annuus]KAJ0607824.1 hypothetical protein HanHA89_Chr03g0101231 [Helianthus annuus]KAJ0767888.1 hypothetical protein HanLR1_Chr03g0094601 [Helianthus annuus]